MVKLSKKARSQLSELQESVSEFVLSFLQELPASKGKVNVESLLEAWNDEENKNRLTEMLKLRMPEKTEKKEKDPNAPKRPTSAYFFFAKEKRVEVKET